MKHLFFFCVLLLTTPLIKAQSIRDSLLIAPRLSFADFSDRNDWTGYSINKVPPTALQVEKFYNDYFSYGVFVGFYRDKFTNDTMNTNFHREVNIAFGGVGTFHYGQWIEKITNQRIHFNDFDLYLSMMLGWDVKNTAIRDQLSEDGLTYNDTNDSEVKLIFGPALGVRYYITDRFAMSLEVGPGNLGLITMGLNWNIIWEHTKKEHKASAQPKTLFPPS